MRKINLKAILLFAVLGLLIAGCNKDNNNDDDDIQVDAKLLIAEWNCSSLTYTSTTVTEAGGQSITTTTDAVGYNIDFTFTFNEDPQTVNSEGTYDAHLTITTLGQTMEQDVELQPFDYEGEWSLNGNKLSITADGKTDVATITELTDEKLSIYIETTDVSSQSGATITVTVKTNVSFTK